MAGSEPKRGSVSAGNMTKEEILAIKDPSARRKAIADNLDMFGDMFNGGKK